MITIQHVTKRYGTRTAVDDVSLTFHRGQVTLLLGANGAGKSTLLKCLLGTTGFEGSIRVGGRDPLGEGCAVRSLIGYMPQSGGLHQDLTVAQTMRFYSEIRGVPLERSQALVEQAGLSDYRDVTVGELSGGLRQRLGFALALVTNPSILVLDEPAASLDSASRRWLADRLRALAADGRTIVVSTHASQELLDSGHRRVVLEDGRVIADEAIAPADSQASISPTDPIRRGALLPIVTKELTDAISSRWLIGYASLLAVLGLAAASVGIDSASGLALQAFGRTTATLMNLCLLLAPLVAVLMGAASITGEQERGTLDYLLAQPIARSGLLLAKYAGLLIALSIATLAGFLPAGALIAAHAGAGIIGHYLLFPAIALLAGAALAGVGLFISVASRSAAQSQGTAVFTWFAFVLLYDLVLMSSLAVSGLPIGWLAASLVANPVDAARVLGVLALEPDLYLLGPAGAFLTARLAPSGAAALLLASLALWIAMPVIGAVIKFTLPSERRSLVFGVPMKLANGISILVVFLGLAGGAACSSQAAPPNAASGTPGAAATPAVSAAMLEKGRGVYKTYCVACHGETGKGDGPAGGVMKPPPRDHTDRAYMSTLTDKQITDVIQMGGAMKGKPLMPSHPQIKGDDMAALVAYTRSLSNPK
jgi:ABC-type multidrug transport system ATPase subunit/ABC-type transport system involved in multi-copper enzyme maturation permease subunit/mono/diheme cytochrome c family protein